MIEDWKYNTLGKLCEFGNGLWTGKKPPFVKVGVIRNTNFTKEGKLDDSDIALLDVEKGQFLKRKLQFGDIILEKSGGGPKQPVGRVVVFNKKNGDYSFSNFTSSIRIKNSQELDFNYLHRLLYFKYISGATEKMQSHSTGIRNLKFDDYKLIEIPYPPLSEQKRIVAILDEAFDAIDKAKANLEKNLQNARGLFESYLDGVFANPVMDWEEKRLKDVFEIKPPKSEVKQQLGKSDLVSFLPMEDLNILAYYVKPIKVRKLSDVMGSYTYFAEHDVLLAKITPCFENGKIGIARSLTNGVGFGSSEYIVFRTNGEIISEYLYYYLAREKFREEGKKRMTGAVGHKRVSKEFIEEYIIPFPKAKQEQKSIINQLNIISKETNKLETIYQQKLNDLEELKKSFLQKAFSGELKYLHNERYQPTN